MGNRVSRRASVRRPRTLATCLADFAHQAQALALADLERGAEARLARLYEQARRELTPDLAPGDFADLLAQVLVYVLLLARRVSQQQGETLADAVRALLRLPALPPLVRNLLATLWRDGEQRWRGADELALCVRELASFLLRTDLLALLETLRPLCLQGDPLIYFYEIFLTAYAPHQRTQRGIYYTPEPVISYMVRSLDELLREKFACAGGLAGALHEKMSEDGVLLCDPACGIGAFLWAVLEHARQAAPLDGSAAARWSAVPERQPARLVGCEITPSAYLLACLELAVRQAAFSAPAHEPLPLPAIRLFLTNALADAHLPGLPGAGLPVLLGNPPYAGHSLNHSQRLGRLLESYKVGDADLKRPAQAKWLNDDYVQFLRLAQWQVEQAGRGIVAFLTSHSYLDNPTFRAMRLSLLRSFDEIYILDLHGNSKRRELAPGGEPDRNIFTIQQGVAIGIFVKYAPRQTGASLVPGRRQHASSSSTFPQARVYHADVWGLRAVYAQGARGAARGTHQLSGGKLGWLAEHSWKNTSWQACQPVAPFYLFTPRDESHQSEYATYWRLPDIFALNGQPAPGLLTCHDAFAIAWSAEEMAEKIAAFLATSSEEEARALFRLCAQSQWNYARAYQTLASGSWRSALGCVSYRPFDTRWTVFERHVAVHLRERVTRHMRAGPNLALIVGRAGQAVRGGAWDVAFCSRLPTEFNFYRRGGNYIFPLYLYPAGGGARVANLAPAFIAQVSQRLALDWLADGSGDLLRTFGPEDIFAYIYAWLYAPAYRARYADFLKIDFPRLPLPDHLELFRTLCQLGRALSQAHLLEQTRPGEAAWSGEEATLVNDVRYLKDSASQTGQIFINEVCSLSPVPEAAWSMTIGGYQIARKWLQDRSGRRLSRAELVHYRQVIASLVDTLDLMDRIEQALVTYHAWLS